LLGKLLILNSTLEQKRLGEFDGPQIRFRQRANLSQANETNSCSSNDNEKYRQRCQKEIDAKKNSVQPTNSYGAGFDAYTFGLARRSHFNSILDSIHGWERLAMKRVKWSEVKCPYGFCDKLVFTVNEQ